LATDEELEAVFGEPRPPPRLKEITEDEWRHLMHVLDRVDRRIGRLSHWSVTVIAGGAAWIAADIMRSDGRGAWATGIVAVAVFLVLGILGQRDLDQDDLPAWSRGRRRWRMSRHFTWPRIVVGAIVLAICTFEVVSGLKGW
jgi:hypothetical protein